MINQHLFFYLAPIMAIVAVLIGIAAMLRPKDMSKKFGIPAAGEALPYLVSVGIRDIFMGLALFLSWRKEDWLSLGYLVCGVGLVAVFDFVTVFQKGDRRVSLVHIAGALIAFGYGAWLLLS